MKKPTIAPEVLQWAESGQTATLAENKQLTGYTAGPNGAGEAPFYQHLNLMFQNLFRRAKAALFHQSERDQILGSLTDVASEHARATLHWNGTAFVDAASLVVNLTGPQRLLVQELNLTSQDLDLSGAQVRLEMDGLDKAINLNTKNLILGDASGEVRLVDASGTPGQVQLKGRCDGLRILTDGNVTVDASDAGFSGAYELNGISSHSQTQADRLQGLPQTTGGVMSYMNSFVGFKNKLINGGFMVNQRRDYNAQMPFGGSTTGYVADRWFCWAPSSGNNFVYGFSRYAADGILTPASLAAFPDLFHYLKMARYVNQVETDRAYLGYAFEDLDLFPMRGKEVTLSFLACRFDQYSAANNLMKVEVLTSSDSGHANSRADSANYSNVVLSQEVTLGLDLERFTVSFTLPATTQALCLRFSFQTMGVVTSGEDGLALAQVQLELGNQFTGYESRPYGYELHLCQRYFEKVGMGTRMYTRADGTGAWGWVQFQTPKRTENYSVSLANTTTALLWAGQGFGPVVDQIADVSSRAVNAFSYGLSPGGAYAYGCDSFGKFVIPGNPLQIDAEF